MNLEFLKQNNVDVAKSLELFGDVQIYNETFQDYLDGIEEKKANLAKFKNLASWADYAIFAHSIKSDARYLGFTEMASIALNHEMAGKEGNQHFIEKEYDSFIKEIDRMTDIIKRYLAGEKASSAPKTLDNEEQTEKKEDVIIVADDSKLVCNFAIKVLDGKIKTIPAFDGQEAINIINSQKYNIKGMLLDLNMPNVGGFEVLDAFKKYNLFTKIPISIITGEDSKDMVNKAFTYNIVDMLVKPFSDQELKRVVEKTILK